MDDWQRLDKIIRWTGMSVNAFALNIGLRRSENLYQIKRGNNGISKELAETIVMRYPNISKGWILAGEGEMFCNNTTKNVAEKSISFFNRDISFVATHIKELEADDQIWFKRFEECSFAGLYLGDSMTPEIPPGAIVIVKEDEVDNIIPGGIYVIISDIFNGIRYVRSGSEPGKLRLVPANKASFDEIEMGVDKIKQILSVQGIIVDKKL